MADERLHPAGALNRRVSTFADALRSGLAASRHSARAAADGLPLAQLTASIRPSSAHHVITPIDGRGRLADRSAIRLMQWAPHTPLKMQPSPEAVIVRADHSTSTASITRHGHLRLPAPIRRAYRLDAGDRLLVVACPDAEFLAIIPIVQLERMMLAWLHHQTDEATS